MTQFIADLQLVAVSPPVFRGRHGRTPLTIRLDSSAYMKVLGNHAGASLQVDDAVLVKISSSAEALLAERQNSDDGPLDITISALDLD